MSDLSKHMVVALVFLRRDESILLVKQCYGKRYWSLPGGIVEPFESIEEAAIREVKEETNLDIKIRELVGVYSKVEEDALAITLEGEIIGGTVSPSGEIENCAYFPADELPAEIRPHLCGRVKDYLNYSGKATLRVD